MFKQDERGVGGSIGTTIYGIGTPSIDHYQISVSGWSKFDMTRNIHSVDEDFVRKSPKTVVETYVTTSEHKF